MARKAVSGISYVDGKGYRLTVGKSIGTDGKERYRTWWLGHDAGFAKWACRELRDMWELWTREGNKHWEKRHIDSLLNAIRTTYEGQARLLAKKLMVAENEAREMKRSLELYTGKTTLSPTAVEPARIEIKTPMLYAAADAYVEAIKAKPLSPSYKRRLGETVDHLKAFRPDVPLAEIDRVWLESLTDLVKSRPPSRRKRKGRKPTPIAAATVKTLLQHWRQLFDWIDRAADSNRFGHWELPRRGGELFNVDLASIRTKAERDRAADGPEQLTVEEIKKLVHAANDRQRMLILLGLFAGLGQTELRWCRRDEFDLDRGTFSHRRNKTGQQGCWFLPEELVDLLRNYFQEVEPLEDGSAFSTREGSPLVTEKSDSVGQMFLDVRDTAQISRPGVTFYALRRFLGDRAKRAGGIELRDAALAHAGYSVGDRHYSNYRDFAKVEQLGRALYKELKQAGLFDWSIERENAVAA